MELGEDAEAVMLDFVNPAGAGGRRLSWSGSHSVGPGASTHAILTCGVSRIGRNKCRVAAALEVRPRSRGCWGAWEDRSRGRPGTTSGTVDSTRTYRPSSRRCGSGTLAKFAAMRRKGPNWRGSGQRRCSSSEMSNPVILITAHPRPVGQADIVNEGIRP